MNQRTILVLLGFATTTLALRAEPVSEPILRKQNCLVTGEARVQAIHGIQYGRSHQPITEVDIRTEYYRGLHYNYRMQGYTAVSGFPTDIVTKDWKFFSYIETDGRLVPLVQDNQGYFHFQALNGPIYPELQKAIADRLAEIANWKKEAEQAKANQQAELKDLTKRTLLLKSKRTWLVRPEAESIRFAIGYFSCDITFDNPDRSKFWQIPPFEAEVELALIKNKTFSGPVLRPLSPSREGWKIKCQVNDRNLLSEALKEGGITIEKKSPAPFFPPQQPPVAFSTFQISPTPDGFEHLAPGSKVVFHQQILFPPSGTFPSSATYLLKAKGPLACRLVTTASPNLRKILSNSELRLSKSTTYRLSGAYYQRVWRWEVSGIPDVTAFECSQRDRNTMPGLSNREVQAVLEGFAQLRDSDGTKIEPLEQDWKDVAGGVIALRPDDYDFRRFLPDNTEIRLEAAKIPLLPGDNSVSLTRASASISCTFEAPAGVASKQRILSSYSLSIRYGKPFEDSTDPTLVADAGNVLVPIYCKLKAKVDPTIANLKASLKPDVVMTNAAPIVFGASPEREILGHLRLAPRYRDCTGKIGGDFAFVFRQPIEVAAHQSQLNLANGCSLKFVPSAQDRRIQAEDALFISGWSYARSVDETATTATKGKFHARAFDFVTKPVDSLECTFESRFEADRDPAQSCESEFIDSLTQITDDQSSSIRFVLKADRSDFKAWP